MSSGYLQRMGASALNPGGSIRPMLGSVFSPSANRGMPENFRGEEKTTPLGNRPESRVTPQPEEGAVPGVRPELSTTAPAPRIHRGEGPETGPSTSHVPSFQILTSASEKTEQKRSGEPRPEERTSFKPSVNKSQQREVEMPAVSSSISMNYGDEGLDEPQGVSLRSKPELVTPGRDASRILQNAWPDASPSGGSNVTPFPTVTLVSGKDKQQLSAEPGSEGRASFNALVTPRRRDVENSEVVPKARYEPLVAENFGRTERPRFLRDTSNPLTPDVRREEERNLLRRLRPPEREPDEIQIHIGRIEVTAMPPAPARAEPRPARKSPSLDEYLKRGEGRPG